MSYLLDALKKANGEEPTNIPSVQSASPVPVKQEGNSSYQWLSAVLAVLLALTVGYLFGTKWSWVEQQIIVQPAAVIPDVKVRNEPTVSSVNSENNATLADTPHVHSSAESNGISKEQPTEQLIANVQKSATGAAKAELNTSQVAPSEMPPQVPQEGDALLTNSETTKTLVVTKNDNEVVVEEEKPLLQEDEMVLGYVPEELREKADPNAQVELEDVSPELLAQFKMAVEESDAESSEPNPVFDTDIVAIHELNQTQQAKIPAMSFTTHIYATEAAERWVKINGNTVKEGQWLSSSLQLVDIYPQYIVMAINGRRFTLAALTDWEGVQ